MLDTITKLATKIRKGAETSDLNKIISELRKLITAKEYLCQELSYAYVADDADPGAARLLEEERELAFLRANLSRLESALAHSQSLEGQKAIKEKQAAAEELIKQRTAMHHRLVVAADNFDAVMAELETVSKEYAEASDAISAIDATNWWKDLSRSWAKHILHWKSQAITGMSPHEFLFSVDPEKSLITTYLPKLEDVLRKENS